MKKEMKKKIANRSLLILLSVAIVVALILIFNGSESFVDEDSKQEKQIILEQKMQECKELTSDVLKNACYITLASDEADVSICEEIVEGTKDRELCKKEVYISLKDSESCGDLYYMEHKDDCYHKIALSTDDSSLCQKITDTSIKEECMEDFN